MSYNLTNDEIAIRKFFDKSNDRFFDSYVKTSKIKDRNDKVDFIEETISSDKYPRILMPFVKKLYVHSDTDNLYNLAVNLRNVKIQRINPFIWLLLDKSYGTYDSNNNIITYFNKDSIPHELLHLASTVDGSHSGFNLIKNGYNFGNGFNEGYTELLSQRVFFNSVFTKSAYKTDVYLLRLFELLYDSPKEMEKAYFMADFESPIKEFLKYGSLEEYKYLLKHLDYFATTNIWDNEENIVFELLLRKVEKTGEKCKVKKANNIYDEYRHTERLLHK